jgi:hypothetical protein
MVRSVDGDGLGPWEAMWRPSAKGGDEARAVRGEGHGGGSLLGAAPDVRSAPLSSFRPLSDGLLFFLTLFAKSLPLSWPMCAQPCSCALRED